MTKLFRAKASRTFSFGKFSKEFKKGQPVENLTQEDVNYLSGNNPKGVSVITDIEEMVKEVVEEAVVEPKVEKAVKKTTTRKRK